MFDIYFTREERNHVIPLQALSESQAGEIIILEAGSTGSDQNGASFPYVTEAK